jgi:non-homologous end joining protein Ku
LIEKMSSPDFEPERYADEYRERALAMIEKKVKGNARRKQATLIPMMAVTENSVSTCGVSHHEPRRGTNNPRLPRKPTIKPFISLIPL